jgi:hypothetical protein
VNLWPDASNASRSFVDLVRLSGLPAGYVQSIDSRKQIVGATPAFVIASLRSAEAAKYLSLIRVFRIENHHDFALNAVVPNWVECE